jgi:hypothetical protein
MTSVLFFYSAKERDEELAAAFQEGVLACGERCETRLLPAASEDTDADFIGLIGTKNQTLIKHFRARGRNVLYFDKGFSDRASKHRNGAGMWRVSVNTQQPTEYVATARHDLRRWQEIFGQTELPPWRRRGKQIVIAHSSEKYSRLADLPSPTEWVERVVAEVRKHTDRAIFYRPKPSWKAATPIPGARFVRDWPLARVLKGAHALITHGSYVCVDALVAGIPAIILGDAVTRPVSSTSLAEIEAPRLASMEERQQILANLAWAQYSIDEYRNGFAWRMIKELFLPGAAHG